MRRCVANTKLLKNSLGPAMDAHRPAHDVPHVATGIEAHSANTLMGCAVIQRHRGRWHARLCGRCRFLQPDSLCGRSKEIHPHGLLLHPVPVSASLSRRLRWRRAHWCAPVPRVPRRARHENNTCDPFGLQWSSTAAPAARRRTNNDGRQLCTCGAEGSPCNARPATNKVSGHKNV